MHSTAVYEAPHGTFLKSASAPDLHAALPAACWNGRWFIPLVRCNADRDSGRNPGLRSFDPKDAAFRRAP